MRRRSTETRHGSRSHSWHGPLVLVAERRSVRGYVRWIVGAPGFGLRFVSLASLILAGAATGESGERLVAVAITFAVLTPLTYVGWRYRWWRQRWPHDDF